MVMLMLLKETVKKRKPNKKLVSKGKDHSNDSKGKSKGKPKGKAHEISNDVNMTQTQPDYVRTGRHRTPTTNDWV